MKVLFQRPHFARGLGRDGLVPLLPGWQIDWCAPDQTAGQLDDTDVICPSGVPVDRGLGHGRGTAMGGQRPAVTSRAGSGILKAWPTICA